MIGSTETRPSASAVRVNAGILKRSKDCKVPMQSHPEGKKMQELAKQSKSCTSTVLSNTVRDELILEHLPQIKYIAQRISTKLPSHVELNDLVSAGILGLLDAIDKFDESRGVKFKTYAELRIKGAI